MKMCGCCGSCSGRQLKGDHAVSDVKTATSDRY